MKAKGFILRWTYAALAAMALALVAAPAAALEPEQVLVVANADSMDSVSLAKTYAELRSIPAENVLALSSTVKYAISREEYEKKIRLPIRKYLRDKGLEDRITCIVVMYGVPVRIEPAALPRQADQRYRTYGAAVTLAQRRLATNTLLARSVGVDFPEPRTPELAPLSKLFAPSALQGGKDSEVSADFAEGLGDLLRALADKHKDVQALTDETQRTIASRQLMALYQDVGGLQGLANYIRTEKPAGAPDLDAIEERIREAEELWAQLRASDEPPTPETAQAEIDLANTLGGLAQVRGMANAKATMLGPESTDASLDSELALLAWDNDYDLAGWVHNPLHWRRQAEQADDAETRPVYMTCRIDGPTRADVRRLIRASSAVEKTGLKGTFYIDAGGLQPRYDDRLKLLANMIKDRTAMKSVLDTTPHVFAPDSCPDAALYVGWHSPRRYVPAFAWNEGAVGWHIASFEAVRLRDSSSPDWAPKMIQNGVAATVGAVNEPFLGAFPPPEEFFPLLLTGKFTLAECYWRTIPHASWRLTLIGDPLYNPFAKNPQMKLKDLPKGLAPVSD